MFEINYKKDKISVTFFIAIRLLNIRRVYSLENNELEHIYFKYYNELYIYVFSLCKNHYLAEEIVSDAFYKAFASIEVSNNHIKYWLFRVSKNIWIDKLRKNKKISFRNTDEVETIESNEIDTLEKIINDERKQNIYKHVCQLSGTYKEAITLYYFCGFSLKEISISLNISAGATRTLLYRARNKLKKILKDVK